jgi:hypothetical protein
MTIKINDIFLECPHRTPKRLHVETYLFFFDRPPRIPRWLHVEASLRLVIVR